jgi:hypothetical protein
MIRDAAASPGEETMRTSSDLQTTRQALTSMVAVLERIATTLEAIHHTLQAEQLPSHSSQVLSSANNRAVDKGFREPEFEQAAQKAAVDTLTAILKEYNGTIPARIPNHIISIRVGAKHPLRDEVRRLLGSEDFPKSEQGWSYNASDRTITLAK